MSITPAEETICPFYQWFVHDHYSIPDIYNYEYFHLPTSLSHTNTVSSNLKHDYYSIRGIKSPGHYHATIPITGSLPTEIGLMTHVEDLFLYINEFTGSLSQRRYVCWRMLNICFLLMTSSRAPYQRRSTCWRMPSLSILTSTSSQVRSQRRSVYWRMSGSPSC